MLHGSCLCGGVAYRTHGSLSIVHHCHCSMCRKAHGSAFSTGGATGADDFAWLSGEDLAVTYRSSEEGMRRFCARCGGMVPNSTPDGSVVFLPAGCLDGDDVRLRVLAHIFVGSKAPWHDITDGLPRFDEYPPGFGVAVDGPVGCTDEPRALGPDSVRGSCLCGAVAFEARPPFGDFQNCHCSRCRKMVGAAYASDFTCAADAFRWRRGEDRLRRFDLPDAVAFSTAFCDTCGAQMPHPVRIDPSRVLVQAGALDDDPGVRPACHIFVRSKVPWLEITDGLPRFERYPA